MMELFLLFFPVWCALGYAQHRRRVGQSIKAALASLSPQKPIRWKGFLRQEASVEVEGFDLTVTNHGNTTSILLSNPSAIPSTLELERDLRFGLPSFLCRKQEDLEIGDAVFDQRMRVAGPPALVLSLLDAHTRELASLVIGAGVRVGRGSLYRECPSAELDSGWSLALAEQIRSMMSLGRCLRLSGAPSVRERLATNAATDPLSEVRLRNLRVLLATYPASDEAHAAARLALADENLRIRLEGAGHLGAEALGTWRDLATHPSLPRDIAAGALEGFGRFAPPDEAAALLLDAAKHRRGSVRRTAIAGLGRLRHRAAIGALAVILENGDADDAAAAARALGAVGGTEAALLGLIRTRHTEALGAVIDVLGHSGSIEAVPLLRDLSQQSDVPSLLRLAARDAVRRIQARAPGAGAGQLAIAEAPDPEGALSLVEDESPRGRLSLAEPPIAS